MLDLLKNYSLDEIAIFIVLLALAVKGVISFFDWGKERLDRIYRDRYNIKEEKNNIEQTLENHSNEIKEIIHAQVNTQEQIEKLIGAIDMLIASDKDDIKAYITKEHHYFCYEKGYIDDYSLDCLERRYGHYKDEGGNSFAEDLMRDVRALPKVSNATAVHQDK